MSRCRYIPWSLVLFAVVCIPSAGCRDSGKSKHELPRVKIAQPIVREVNDYQFFIGRTGAVQSVSLQAKVTGYLWAIDYLDGTILRQDVKKGQRLFKIDPRPFQASLDQAHGQLNLAKARLVLAIADYKRAVEVAKTPGAISQQDVDKYAASEAEARAEVQAQEANVEAAKLNVGYTSIDAPFDGRVSRNLVDKDDLVKQNETLLATVVTEDPIYVYVDVDDQTMMRVKRLMQEGKIKTTEQGGKFPFDIGLSDEGDEYLHTGELDYVSNQLDPTTGTLQIRGVFSNPKVTKGDGPRLMEPSQFVRVRISMGPKFPALLIPQAAIGTDQGKKYVLVVVDRGSKKNIVEYRPVRLGQEQPDGLQVVFPVPMVKSEEGLQPVPAGPESKGTVPSLTKDDWVITDGLQFAPRGKQVDARKEPIPADKAAVPADKPQAKSATTRDATMDSRVPLPPVPEEHQPQREGKTKADNTNNGPRLGVEPEVPLPPAPADDSLPASKPQ